MNIVVQKNIDPAHWQHLTGWRERVFPEEGRDMEWSEPAWHLLVFDAGDLPVAHVGYDRFEIRVAGVECAVMGIGGVVVRPECQGRGIPRRMFDVLHRDAGPALGVDIHTLFCPQRLVTYYQKFGYQQHRDGVTLFQFGQPVPSSFQFLYRAPAPLSGPVELTTPPW